MGLRIGTNVASIYAQNQLGRTVRETSRALEELASGSRFTRANSDAAGFAISENLRGQIAGYKAAEGNANVASAFVQTAEGGLNEQNNLLIRMRELAIQAASDNYSDQEREFLNQEFTQLREEVDRIAKVSTFGSTPLLQGKAKTYNFQVGTHSGPENIIRYTNDTNTTGSELGIDSLEVADSGDAQDSLETIDEALTKIASARANFGAIQSRLDSAASHLSIMNENITEARSRLADADIGAAISNARRGMIMQQYQAYALSMANQSSEVALKLFA